MVSRHLYYGDIERLFGWEHELEGHPDAVIHTALNALGLDPRPCQVLPHIPGEFWGVFMWPIVLVNEGLRVMKVVDEIMLVG